MNFAERNRIIIAKMQALSEKKKKIILWTIVAVVGIILGFFWVRGVMDGYAKISSNIKSIKLPEFDLPKTPAVSFPDILQTVTPTNK